MSDFDFESAPIYSGNDVTEQFIKIGEIEGTVYVRKLTAIDLRRFYEEVNSADENRRVNAGFGTLIKAIRNADGSQALTLDKLKNMTGEGVTALMKAFTNVNTPKKEDADAGNV